MDENAFHNDELVDPIPEEDKNALEVLLRCPVALVRGLLRGEVVTFACLMFNEGNDTPLSGPDEVEGGVCCKPFAVLRGLTPEDMDHCLDPDGQGLGACEEKSDG